MKVFNKPVLAGANKLAGQRGYNRQIEPAAIEALPDGAVFPVSFCMLHEHAAGKAVDPHVRCMISTPIGSMMLDVDAEVFDALPEINT
jgi:hypothetical protein